MGGAAFPGRPIVRIPAALLPTLLTNLAALLSPYFTIRHPRPAPSKLTHGDLDLLVSPLPSSRIPHLTTLLSATASTTTRNSPTTSFAIPLAPDAEFQLDIHVCASLSQLKWTHFTHSDGDLWNILSNLLRRVGIKINHEAMWLRVPQIRDDGANGSVELTREPDEVLRFLGYAAEEYRNGWESVDDMFRFVERCRFFDPQAFVGLNAKDRSRVRKREVYKRFVEEWVPGLVDDGRCGDEEEVRREALEWFGKGAVFDEMVERREMWRATEQEWRGVKSALELETETEMGITVRWLRRRWEENGGAEGLSIAEFVKRDWREARRMAEEDAMRKRREKRRSAI